MFLVLWFCTLGFGLLGWIIDGFRVYFWVGSHTIVFHGDLDWNTLQLNVRDGGIVHRIRSAVYKAMARTRQLDQNTKAETISQLSCKEQMESAPSNMMSKGYGLGGKGLVTMVITKDRVLLKRYYPGCCCNGDIKYEWEAIFLKDIEGIEITKPAQWPTVSIKSTFLFFLLECHCKMLF